MAGQGGVHIEYAENVYNTTNLHQTHVHPLDEKAALCARCGNALEGLDGVGPPTPSCPGRQRDVYNVGTHTCTHLYVNEKAVQILVENDYSLEKCGEEVSKCLARFSYHGDAINVPEPKARTAMKLTLKDGMKRLLKDFIEVIRGGGSKDKMIKLTRDCIQKNAKLMGIDLGSLVFIFEHSSQADADRMVSAADTDLQQEVKRILVDFLPDWVKESDVEWTFQRCEVTGGGGEGGAVDLELGNPIQLGCPLFQTMSSGDLQLMEWMVERKLSSLYERIANTQKEALREVMKEMRALLNKLSLTSEPDTSQKAALKDGGRGATRDDDDDLYSGPEQLTSQTQEFDSNNLTEKGIVHNPGDSKQQHWQYGDTSNYAQHQTAEAAFVCETAAAGHESLRPHPKSLDEQASSANPHRNSSQAVGQRDEREKGEHESPRPHPKSHDDQASSMPASVNPHRNASQAIGQIVGRGKGETALQETTNPKNVDKEYSSHRQSTRQGSGVDRSSESGDDPKTADAPTISQESIRDRAEDLLNWVNVKSKASQSRDPEIQRMMQQVEHSLHLEKNPSPRAKALDTVIVLDTSESVVKDSLDQLKQVVHTFIEEIEINVETMNLEENVGVVQIGQGRAWVRQHLTCDYNRVRDAVDKMTPDSEEMPTGGRSPLFQALVVCLGAIEGRGGVVNVAGCHRVRPRLIFFTDGCPTDEASELGADTQSNINEVKYALVQLISEFASKKHKTTPSPIFWVPVGSNCDMSFLESSASLSGGEVVPAENVQVLCRYYKVQEMIGTVFKMVRKHKDLYETEQQMMTIINALSGDLLNEAEKSHIMVEVRKKQKEPQSESSNADDFENVYEDTEHVADKTLLPLGTRVRRGRDWKWQNQDTDCPGTVIQHRKQRDGWLHVMWDNGNHNGYRYGDGECYDVREVEEPRILLPSEGLIEVGVRVVRGEDWKSNNEDGGSGGTVVRKRKDGKVRVRWDNGHIGKYRFGADGKMEIRLDPDVIANSPAPMHTSHSEPDSGFKSLQPEGAVGGAPLPEDASKRRVWLWQDSERKEWRMYSARNQDKLLKAYRTRRDGTCILERAGLSRRVLFKTNQEKTVDKGGGMLQVKTEDVSDDEYFKMLHKEEER